MADSLISQPLGISPAVDTQHDLLEITLRGREMPLARRFPSGTTLSLFGNNEGPSQSQTCP